jgi:hypothetical protein
MCCAGYEGLEGVPAEAELKSLNIRNAVSVDYDAISVARETRLS